MSGQTKKAATNKPRNVANAIVIKSEDVFLLCRHDGGMPAANQDGFGLYYHDCRYLDGYELQIAGTAPNALVSTAQRGSIAEFELTNETLQIGGNSIPEQTFGITLQRVIDSKECAVHDVISVKNYDVRDHDLPLSIRFHSNFEDVFVIRGITGKKTGKKEDPEWTDGVLVLRYDGADGVKRIVEIHPDPKPAKTSSAQADFELHLKAGEQKRLTLSIRIKESKEQPKSPQRHATNPKHVAQAIDERSHDWLEKYADVHSDSDLLNHVTRRCLLDLLALRSELDGFEYISAGLPWYGTLFGRDSIIASLETLAFEPTIAEQTIRLLAKYQGTKTDNWRDEEPGKILHELRRGELANLNEIPQTPYYGSVDSTPLFLILVGEHAQWTGDLSLFKEHKQNVERALHWIDHFGDLGHNGYLSYDKKSSKGLGNQGWKDSGDSIMNADGSLATPPIALVEVQGYVYMAKSLMADVYSRTGDDKTATRLRSEAADLKRRFNRDFWIEDKGFYAIALQKDNRPAAVISSNPGQALWTGIVDDDKAAKVVHRIMAEDMFSGWGVRTLSNQERRANPIGYHLGTVWPHDNSIIAAGMRRYSSDDAACQVFDGIVHAARFFQHYRLPEVFAGFSRNEFRIPVRYPVACHPQAWAAGSVPFFLTSLLGLVPDALNKTLRIDSPVLPKGVSELEFKRVKIGDGTVDLRFTRDRNGVHVDVGRHSGSINVEVEQRPQPKAA